MRELGNSPRGVSEGEPGNERRRFQPPSTKAIRAIAARRKIDLVGLLRERFGLTTADELGIRQASNLIDELKGDEGTGSPANGNGAYAVGGAK